MNELTVIVTYYNEEEYIRDCIRSLKNQRNQDFNVIIVNDGSEDKTTEILLEELQTYDKEVQIINFDKNKGHAKARNKAIENVNTDYFMFLDADDQLASYAIGYYLKNIDGMDALIAPIYKFTLRKPQFINQNVVKVKKLNYETNANSFLRKNSACNILFKTSIVKKYNVKFNEELEIYTDNSFLIDYASHVNDFIRIFNFPFYYRGEVYDPFKTKVLTEQEFDKLFVEYTKSFFDSLKRNKNKVHRKFLIDKMKVKIIKEFNPSQIDIQSRYVKHSTLLSKIAKELNFPNLNEGKFLFQLEMLLLRLKKPKLGFKVNKFRKYSRHIKNIILRSKSKNKSIYSLFDSESNVDDNLIVFETFGGKNYSDSPKYIYEYMLKNYPDYKYVWILKNPSKSEIPGNPLKIKKGSLEYYKAYSKAKVWVNNARLPLTLSKKENQKYIQTWHGTPLKRLANDMKVVRMPGTTTPQYKRNFHMETSRWDYLVSPNHYSSEIFESAFWMDEERVLEIGYPRNDLLVTHANDEEFISKIRENVNIPEGKKVLMYAPTWRDDEFIKKGQYLFELKINLENLYESIGDEYVILLRMHYLISNAIDLSGYENFAIDVSDYDDISELYLITDALITDYSSVMFDYGILKRPQFFFAYDIEKYDKDLRGFYLDYANDLPGPIFDDPFDLADSLKDIDLIKESYQDKIDEFYERFCSLEQGESSKYIGELINKEIKK
ncbi:bifunctional glycosyltransferase/CDP-glycerol:glycerophosphate glycerophosphotransferase [Mammaliicoccus sciuri]|uniref:bifunctional glycosyltransferase/CDP-glycerol:glycerophosphate glycerophosphotransferase n=1 Tax=Mammaliicoccus sciuri TaxID=1296 RepID=UPI00194F335B|nr:bifunctional glycosyltransferase family 2 protein/CDP-glycerol:glycerophosphate glycerophosphotransferase [Mammaliicoccus sciuri]MCD8846788.1 CDP-glycerol:glycerophosphate glycerophosphotransferase [Mammaliicoccus sciuri]MEB7402698.1 CDP-glycerol:glycerophosphate glycerophosphotransferase [Mammaliicoccus sciuri]MEB7839738.1 CDP-glycerol:glycerophosphate glycerophosphotransferase [Mammaliicoccus sciuri]MEB8129110.1 CDP-glycerol:glycerophosphate glycerophosphotransferase [Mammaliicoccus sciuri